MENRFSSGIMLSNENTYSIYEIYNKDANIYYLCLPNITTNNYKLYLSFPSYGNNNKDKQLSFIKDTANVLYQTDLNIAYLIPDISPSILKEAGIDNDDKLYNELFNKISISINEAYKLISSKDITVDPVISIIKTTNNSTKFANWLETKLPRYINSVTLPKENIIISEPVKEPIIKTPVKVLKKDNHGYINITIITIIISLLIGIIVPYLIIK